MLSLDSMVRNSSRFSTFFPLQHLRWGICLFREWSPVWSRFYLSLLLHSSLIMSCSAMFNIFVRCMLRAYSVFACRPNCHGYYLCYIFTWSYDLPLNPIFSPFISSGFLSLALQSNDCLSHHYLFVFALWVLQIFVHCLCFTPTVWFLSFTCTRPCLGAIYMRLVFCRSKPIEVISVCFWPIRIDTVQCKLTYILSFFSSVCISELFSLS